MGAAATRATTDAEPKKAGMVVLDAVSGVVKGAMVAAGVTAAAMFHEHASRYGLPYPGPDPDPASPAGVSAQTVSVPGMIYVTAAACHEFLLDKVQALNNMIKEHIYTAGAITHDDGSEAAVRISYLSVDDVFEIVIDGKVFTASTFAMDELLDAIRAHGSATLCAALVQEATEKTRAQTWSVAVEFVDKSTTLRVFRSVIDDLVDAEITKAGNDSDTSYRIHLGREQTYQFTRTWIREKDEANETSSTVSGTTSLVLRIPATLAASAEGLCDVVSAASKSTNVYAWFRPDRVLLLEN